MFYTFPISKSSLCGSNSKACMCIATSKLKLTKISVEFPLKRLRSLRGM
uniref:Uncharacterized protein n=1 Tax=Manihot esculenta TaxID=3983 RepID=A0A2C9WGH4_MANES